MKKRLKRNAFVNAYIDPNGSWTGTVPAEPNEKPTQDVDDL